MIAALALAVLAATAPTDGYTSWIKNDVVHVRFYDLSRIHGPFKFYVSTTSYPQGNCASCPSGVTPEYTVPPEMIYQTWPMGRKCAEATFPLSAVGGNQFFYFTAVTCVADGDHFLCTGSVPHSQSN